MEDPLAEDPLERDRERNGHPGIGHRRVSMRLVGGDLRGRRLEAPAGRDIRPTSDRTREAVFNILAHAEWAPEIEGIRVLDGFCGTGALGLEALSRGAGHAVFMDQGREALDLVRRNIAALGVGDRSTVLRADALRPPRAQAPCPLVFLDPPYGQGMASKSLTALMERGWCVSGGLAVVETGLEDPFELDLERFDERVYGDTRVYFLRITCGFASPPSEQSFDVGELQFDVGRAAVVALAAVGRCFHLAQQGVHFVLVQAAAGADGAVTGHGRADGVEPFAQAEGVA